MSAVSEVRPSPIAGRWYSDDPGELVRQMEAFTNNADIPSLEGQIVGLIVPHAGHRYSGWTAGHAFKAVLGLHFDIVAVASPYHNYHPAEILLSGHKVYATPLGRIEIDQSAMEIFTSELIESGQAQPEEVVYDQEHSLEIELPFLQTALEGNFKLLPVMVRGRTEKTCKDIGKALAKAVQGRSALLVASSDLSHFYPEPRAIQFDGEMLRLIAAFSPEEILRADAAGSAFACGAGAIASVLWAARELGADKTKILHYSTSASETGDPSSVVGYGAAVILKSK